MVMWWLYMPISVLGVLLQKQKEFDTVKKLWPWKLSYVKEWFWLKFKSVYLWTLFFFHTFCDCKANFFTVFYGSVMFVHACFCARSFPSWKPERIQQNVKKAMAKKVCHTLKNYLVYHESCIHIQNNNPC